VRPGDHTADQPPVAIPIRREARAPPFLQNLARAVENAHRREGFASQMPAG
jgi:hypothetical protein